MTKNILLLLACLLIASSARAGKQLTLCYNLSIMPPFIITAPHGDDEADGLLFTFLDDLQERSGFKFHLKNLPSKRCKEHVRLGHIDAMPGLLWSNKRARQYRYPEGSEFRIRHPQRVDTVTNMVFSHRDSKLSWNGESFSNVKFGLGGGFSYLISNKLKKEGVLSRDITSVEQGLNLVLLNKLDGFVVEGIIGTTWAKNHDPEKYIRVLETPFSVEDLHFVFTRKPDKVGDEDAKLIWQAIEAINSKRTDTEKN